MATVLDSLLDKMRQEGDAHIKAMEKLVHTRKDRKRLTDGKPNIAKNVKFLKDISYKITVSDKGITMTIISERIEGSLLDVAKEYIKTEGLSESQFNAYAVAKALAVRGVADTVSLNNRRLRGVVNRVELYAAELQIKIGSDLLKNFSIDDLNIQL